MSAPQFQLMLKTFLEVFGGLLDGKKLREAGFLDVINLLFPNLFRCVSYILVYICHGFIGLKKKFWNDNWKSVTQNLQKPLRKAFQLSPAEVAYRFAYIDSSWVKESKYNSNVMPILASPLNLPSLSLWPPDIVLLRLNVL